MGTYQIFHMAEIDIFQLGYFSIMSWFRTVLYLGEKMCKWPRYGIPRVPGLSPGQAAHFSHPVTFGAKRGTVTI
jgi:hypothetical protein